MSATKVIIYYFCDFDKCMLLCVQVWLRLVHSHSVLTPSEYVAYEEQPEFTFQCTVTGPGVQFQFLIRVDGEPLSTGSLITRGITISEPMQLGSTASHQVNITVPATQLNKDTTIDCRGLLSSGGPNTATNRAIATFNVQGKVLPVLVYSHLQEPIVCENSYKLHNTPAAGALRFFRWLEASPLSLQLPVPLFFPSPLKPRSFLFHSLFHYQHTLKLPSAWLAVLPSVLHLHGDYSWWSHAWRVLP